MYTKINQIPNPLLAIQFKHAQYFVYLRLRLCTLSQSLVKPLAEYQTAWIRIRHRVARHLIQSKAVCLNYSPISITRSWWDCFLQIQITRSANWFALRVIWTCKKVPNAKLWMDVIFIQKDASIFLQNSRYPCSRYRDSTVLGSESDSERVKCHLDAGTRFYWVTWSQSISVTLGHSFNIYNSPTIIQFRYCFLLSHKF